MVNLASTRRDGRLDGRQDLYRWSGARRGRRRQARLPEGCQSMSTIDRQRRQRAPSPHTALARRRASLVRTGQRLLRSTEGLVGSCDEFEYEDTDDLNLLLAQLDVLTAVVAERLSAGRAEEDGATLAQLGSSLVALKNFRSS